MEPSAMSNLSTVVTQILTWLGTVLSTITGEPVLMLGVGVFIIGACIGLVKRMLS